MTESRRRRSRRLWSASRNPQTPPPTVPAPDAAPAAVAEFRLTADLPRDGGETGIITPDAGRLGPRNPEARPRPAPAAGPPSSWRFRLVVAAVALVWCVLAGRLVQLQWWDREGLAARADRQRSFSETIPARPGEIVDRHGRVLATTVTVRSLYVNPSRIAQPWRLAVEFAEALQLDADDIFVRIAARRPRQFLWVKRRLSESEVERVRALAFPPDCWGFREEYLRRYPQGTLAAHVLGLRDIDGQGRGGLEESLDPILRGRDGRRVVVRDARGRVVDVLEEVAEPPRHGRTAVLTLDVVVQLYVERALDRLVAEWAPRGACAIVLDPKTCEILAMASRPGFDPNHPAGVPDEAWRNASLASQFEPGSTFKPLIVASALESGAVRREDHFDCENGRYRMGRRLLHDVHPHGVLSLTDVLVRSSNIGMAKIGERMTNAGLHRATLNWGFGSRTGIELPGELPGTVRPLRAWTSYSTGSVPMGQEIAATPLQVIVAHAALANGGRLMSPRLVLDNERPAQTPGSRDAARRPTLYPQVVSSAVSSDVARWIVEGPLTGVVARGTGRQARLDDYDVFGKTGTAQKMDPATGRYSSRSHVSSFVGGAPAHDPRVLVLVVVDEPGVGGTHYGGEVAAPAAASILRQTLVHRRIPPQPPRTAEHE